MIRVYSRMWRIVAAVIYTITYWGVYVRAHVAMCLHLQVHGASVYQLYFSMIV